MPKKRVIPGGKSRLNRVDYVIQNRRVRSEIKTVIAPQIIGAEAALKGGMGTSIACSKNNQ